MLRNRKANKLLKPAMVLIISLLVVLILTDAVSIFMEYKRFERMTHELSTLFLYPQIWHGNSSEKTLLIDRGKELLDLIQPDIQGKQVKTQITFYFCDNNGDRIVDDPETFSASIGLHRKKFLDEFSLCGETGKIISHKRYVWLFTQQQLPTYTTRLFGLKPITISHLENIQVATWNIALVIDTGIHSKSETCIDANFSPCGSSLQNINPLFNVLELPSDQVFIISTRESKNSHLDVGCSLLALNSIEKTGCQDFEHPTFTDGLIHAIEILNATDVESLPVIILVTNNGSQIDKSYYQEQTRKTGIQSYHVFLNEADKLCEFDVLYGFCKDYHIITINELQTIFEDIYSNLLGRVAPRGLLF